MELSQTINFHQDKSVIQFRKALKLQSINQNDQSLSQLKMICEYCKKDITKLKNQSLHKSKCFKKLNKQTAVQQVKQSVANIQFHRATIEELKVEPIVEEIKQEIDQNIYTCPCGLVLDNIDIYDLTKQHKSKQCSHINQYLESIGTNFSKLSFIQFKYYQEFKIYLPFKDLMTIAPYYEEPKEELSEQQKQEEIEEELKEQHIEVIENQIKEHSNNNFQHYCKTNKRIQSSIDRIRESNPNQYISIISQSYILNGNERHWQKQMLISKVRWFSEVDVTDGNYHQVIFRAQNIKFFFDFDFKYNQSNLSNQTIATQLHQGIISLIKQWYNLDETCYKIIWHWNSIQSGAHVTIYGLRTNLKVAKIFCQRLKEMFPQLGQIIDLGKYSLGEKLRIIGPKADNPNNTYSIDIKDPQNYIICYTTEHDLFVSLPDIEKYKLIEDIKQVKPRVLNTQSEQEIQQHLDDFCNKNKISLLSIQPNERGYICTPDSVNCIVCKRPHKVIKQLYLILDTNVIKINCFSNYHKNNEQSLITVWKEDNLQNLHNNLLKIDLQVPEDTNIIPANDQVIFPLTQQIINNEVIGANDIQMPNSEIEQSSINQQDIILHSQLGTGKTKLIKKIIDQTQGAIIIIGSRKTFSQDISKKFGFQIYQKCKGSIIVTPSTRLVIQLESLKRLDFSIHKPQLLILDEFVSLISHFSQAKYCTTYTVFQFISIIQNSTRTVVADAHLDQDYLETFNYLRTGSNPRQRNNPILQPLIKSNPFKPLVGKTTCSISLSMPKTGELIDECVNNILNKLKQGIKTVVYSTSRIFNDKLAKELMNHIDKQQILVINGKDDEKAFHDDSKFHHEEKRELFEDLSLFNNASVVLYTQTLTFGVSFENHHDFQNLIGIIEWKTSNGAQDAMQSLIRFRNIKTMRIFTKNVFQPNIFTSFQSADDYCKSIGYINSGSPEQSVVYNLHIRALIHISKQKDNPNKKLIKYMQDLGITVISNNNKQKFENLKIKHKFQKPQFDGQLITVNDIQCYLSGKQPTSDQVKVAGFQNRQCTIKLIDKINMYPFNKKFILPSHQEFVIGSENIDELNQHIAKYKDQYTDIIKTLPKNIFKIIKTANKGLGNTISKKLEDSLKQRSNPSGIHIAKYIKKVSLLKDIYSVLEDTKLTAEQAQQQTEPLIKDYLKLSNKKMAITQFIESKTPFFLAQNTSAGVERVSVQQYKTHQNKAQLFYAIRSEILDLVNINNQELITEKQALNKQVSQSNKELFKIRKANEKRNQRKTKVQ